jgi:MoaA/NifB/PqqE/SkfB family radical SAM enzyme
MMPNIKKTVKDFSKLDNHLPNWGFFSKDELGQGKLLLLDIDLDRYCSLDCMDCFRQDSVVDDNGTKDLNFGELISIVEEGKKLGLKYVKICGVGEPTESRKLIPLLETLSYMGIGTAVFTKGQGFGNDDVASTFHKRYGITNSVELAERMLDLNVSFMLGFHSFDSKIQDSVVRTPGYTEVRNKALETLVDVGFADSSPTRLAFCNAPVRAVTYSDAFSIYKYARERNIYPVTAVLMDSGRQIDGTFLKGHDMNVGQKIQLWTDIYSWNIEHDLQTLEEVEKDGVSCLPGGHPCNQLGAGLYLTMKGNVVGCPGYIETQGNVREQSLAEIWENSKTRRIADDRFNTGCPPKEGKTLPVELYGKVLDNLKKKYS